MKNLDWENLGFGYHTTNFNVRCYYRDGKWGEIEVSSEETVPIHIAATCLHYGQEAFEGLKAYKGKDGKVRLFRVADNARRMKNSGDYLRMQSPSVELFTEMVKKVVSLNVDFVPAYETGASLYIRPVLLGTGPQVGVSPADEYLFMIFVTPVGPYYKEGFQPIDVIVERDHDRAAPLGTGHVKAGGNYGASLISGEQAHEKGYPSVLYLDSKEKKYIDECGAANFFAIKGDSYVTPKSHSVLPSITNMSLKQIAEDLGLKVDSRPIALEELASFEEAASCGTAAVISPIGSVYDSLTEVTYTFNEGKVGPWSTKLYEQLRGIQLGDVEDTHGWVIVL